MLLQMSPKDDAHTRNVMNKLAAASGIAPHEITLEMLLIGDLGLDSLQLVDLVMRVEDEHPVAEPDEEWPPIDRWTVADLIERLRPAGK